jgi:hypothetical protein
LYYDKRIHKRQPVITLYSSEWQKIFRR